MKFLLKIKIYLLVCLNIYCSLFSILKLYRKHMLASLNLTKYFNLLTFLFTLAIIRNGLTSLTQLFMFWFETWTITGGTKLFIFSLFFFAFFSNFGGGGLFVERGLYQVSFFIFLCFFFAFFSNLGGVGLFVGRGLYQVSFLFILHCFFFLYNTLLTFLIK